MTTVKIVGKPRAAAAGSLEEQADWLYNHPGARMVGVIEFAHVERTEVPADEDKDRSVSLAITMLELATTDQEEPVRKAQRALFLNRTASGTLDIDGEVELSKYWLDESATDISLRESVRLRAGIRIWAEKARLAFTAPNLSPTEVLHELDAIAAGLAKLLKGRPDDE